MRTLKFIVNAQTITKDPTCDFSNLIPGTDGYLRAEFSFSKEWDDYTRVAGFYSVMGKEYSPKLLAEGRYCIIPTDALVRRAFKVQVVGKKLSDGSTLTTNKVEVYQDGGIT